MSQIYIICIFTLHNRKFVIIHWRPHRGRRGPLSLWQLAISAQYQPPLYRKEGKKRLIPENKSSKKTHSEEKDAFMLATWSLYISGTSCVGFNFAASLVTSFIFLLN